MYCGMRIGGEKERRDFSALEKRRFEALRLLKRGIRPTEVARRVGVARQTIIGWKKKYAVGGPAALEASGGRGRKSRLTEEQKESLRRILAEGPPETTQGKWVWTCAAVAQLIQKEFNISYHPGHVWKILVGLGWNSQTAAFQVEAPEPISAGDEDPKRKNGASRS
jgi:transposase